MGWLGFLCCARAVVWLQRPVPGTATSGVIDHHTGTIVQGSLHELVAAQQHRCCLRNTHTCARCSAEAWSNTVCNTPQISVRCDNERHGALVRVSVSPEGVAPFLQMKPDVDSGPMTLIVTPA